MTPGFDTIFSKATSPIYQRENPDSTAVDPDANQKSVHEKFVSVFIWKQFVILITAGHGKRRLSM